MERINEVTNVAKDNGLSTHLDGARLLNAAVATGISAKIFAAPFDSVWIDLSKGLGAPVGGVLAGSAGFIDRAWRFKHQFGGAMRQSGIIAAAGIYALEHHVERLGHDHENAKRLAKDLAQMPGIVIDVDAVETNIIFFSVENTQFTAPEISTRLLDQGVRIGVFDETTMRAVTHLDVDADGVTKASAAMRNVLGV